ncbi:hypothetical protein [Yersinia aldovae]|uniref:hypothetical protein n=1 Tax=Yersinia aldovae TaxID=29483 RepID=UPI00119FBC8D|nr:hypothetical protein [Yersinia aldovae]
MEIWAKTFESNGAQVLVTKDSNDDGNPQVLFRWPEDDFHVSVGPSWNDDDDKSFEMRDKYFDKVDQNIVDTFVTQMRETLSLQ